MLLTCVSIFDDFAKSPSAALCFVPALLNSRYARRRSRFNRVNHCDVLEVRLIPQDSHALHMNFLQSRLFDDFLRNH